MLSILEEKLRPILTAEDKAELVSMIIRMMSNHEAEVYLKQYEKDQVKHGHE